MAKTYVYAVIYDKNGNLLVGQKNVMGYFFHNKAGSGSILPQGQRLNGSGSFCFPGGSPDAPDDPVINALAELLEETNVAFNPDVFVPAPQAFTGGDGVNCSFYGVYFKVPDDQKIEDVCGAINENLEIGQAAAKAITTKTFAGDYDALRAQFARCPKDNELNQCGVISYKDLDKYFTKDDRNTGWFYDIAQHLAAQAGWK